MKESVTYQAIVAEGRTEGALEEARKLVLRLGDDHFGVAPSSVRTRLKESHDLTYLEGLARRILRCGSWEELLAESRKPQRRKPRR